MKYQTSGIRNGLKIELDGSPYVMVYFQFVKEKAPFYKNELKNMLNGNVIERTFRTGETVDAADVEEFKAQYLYEDGDFHNFMDLETYEQIAMDSTKLGSRRIISLENLEVDLLYIKEILSVLVCHSFIEDEIEYCEPGVKGNTATGAVKPATLACGARVNVPLFVEQGERIKVDTRTNEYVSRVKFTSTFFI